MGSVVGPTRLMESCSLCHRFRPLSPQLRRRRRPFQPLRSSRLSLVASLARWQRIAVGRGLRDLHAVTARTSVAVDLCPKTVRAGRWHAARPLISDDSLHGKATGPIAVPGFTLWFRLMHGLRPRTARLIQCHSRPPYSWVRTLSCSSRKPRSKPHETRGEQHREMVPGCR